MGSTAKCQADSQSSNIYICTHTHVYIYIDTFTCFYILYTDMCLSVCIFHTRMRARTHTRTYLRLGACVLMGAVDLKLTWWLCSACLRAHLATASARSGRCQRTYHHLPLLIALCPNLPQLQFGRHSKVLRKSCVVCECVIYKAISGCFVFF